MKENKSIALISSYPPPFGGVSVHTKILAEELSDRNMINILISSGTKDAKDPSYLKRIPELKILHKSVFWHYKIPFIANLYSRNVKVIHCHEGFGSVPFLFFHRFIFGKPIIHTIHNQWIIERYNRLNFFSKAITRIFLKDKKTFWICVNDNAYNQMLELGVQKKSAKVIPAYISRIKKTLINPNDEKIMRNIINFKGDSKLIGVYGFRFYYDVYGRDVYGFNFSIDIFKKLILIKPSVKLVILIPSASPKEDIEKFEFRIRDEGLADNVLTIFDNPIINMNLFWQNLDIYFRPSTDDGDSLAIREALANGIRVIASDVCSRPKQTITYKSLDFNDAIEKLADALNINEKLKIEDDNYLKNLMDLYFEVLSRSDHRN
jgi:hypothetical protein